MLVTLIKATALARMTALSLVMTSCSGMSRMMSLVVTLYDTLLKMGLMTERPGFNTALNLPRRSTTHSSPCGTMRMPFQMRMKAGMMRMNINSVMMQFFLFLVGWLLDSVFAVMSFHRQSVADHRCDFRFAADFEFFFRDCG